MSLRSISGSSSFCQVRLLLPFPLPLFLMHLPFFVKIVQLRAHCDAS
jgi:hypothetical protein